MPGRDIKKVRSCIGFDILRGKGIQMTLALLLLAWIGGIALILAFMAGAETLSSPHKPTRQRDRRLRAP